VDNRVFGLRNQYRVAFSGGAQRQVPAAEAARRLFGPVVSGGQGTSVLLRNGGRLYLDEVSYPEYATPDCGDVLDLAYHDVHRGRGRYYQLQRSGAVDRTARDIDIFEAKTVPPGAGRHREAS